jgi:mRNA-degrading endonuclease RelE of RelBE toxin-antitoxin system
MKNTEYRLETLVEFDKAVGRFVNKKKFRQLPEQLDELGEQLARGEFPGTFLGKFAEPFPHERYKLRLPNPNTKTGKSGGYRVLYIVVTENKIVVLVTIYYKKEQETLSDTYIDGLIDGLFFVSTPDADNETDELP